MIRKLLLSSAFVFVSNFAFGSTYTLDTSHSEVGFKIKHLMISNVKGLFKEFKGTGTGTFSKDQATIDSIDVEINVASIDTNEPKRDEHLKSPEIFNAAKFKTMTFKSTKVEYKGKFPSKIHGDLSLHGVTKPITLDVNWGGVVVDPWKNEKIAFEADGTIQRKDFGITWNKVLETGGVLVGEDVKLHIVVEATRAAEAAPAKK